VLRPAARAQRQDAERSHHPDLREGDVSLESTGGALLANLVVDRALSSIIDVSQLESDTDKEAS
jgi:hypothetical protein